MNTYYFNDEDIRQQLLNFMRSLNLEPARYEPFILDGDIHRYSTKDDKRGQFSGAYCIHTNGIPAGWVQDWRKGEAVKWRFDTRGCSDDAISYFNSEAFRKKAEEDRRKNDAARAKRHLQATEKARIIWDALLPAEPNHKYFVSKRVANYGLRFSPDTQSLAVPLRDINGKLLSLQWISTDGTKRYFLDAPLDGAFFSIALDTVKDNHSLPILIGEGYATMAKVYELTGYPCVAAKDCGSLCSISKIIHDSFPDNCILITADNDMGTEIKRGYNPGIREANATVKRGYAKAVISPPFSSQDEGTDWDDFAISFGDVNTRNLLLQHISWEMLSDEQKNEAITRNNLSQAVQLLDPTVRLPHQEFIGGLFARNFVSLLAAPPGTGKTIFMQKFVSDLSIGGTVFDGFTDDEPQRKCLIFAGEAGYDLLTRRAASLKWAVNPQNVPVVDQYTFESRDIPIMLDDPEGWLNVKRLADMYKPDVIFWDTFSSFHERDENKASEMKPIIKNLAELARDFNTAVVLVHHSRKRAAKERSLSLNQDDVIGSSILNRLVSLIIGIEPMKEDDKTLLVRPLKTWFSAFMPFTYRLTEDFYGHTVMQTDLAPASVNNSRIAVWNYLHDNFTPDEWFSVGDILIEEIATDITQRQLRRILTEFVNSGKLQKKGSTKNAEYSLGKNEVSDDE